MSWWEGENAPLILGALIFGVAVACISIYLRRKHKRWISWEEIVGLWHIGWYVLILGVFVWLGGVAIHDWVCVYRQDRDRILDARNSLSSINTVLESDNQSLRDENKQLKFDLNSARNYVKIERGLRSAAEYEAEVAKENSYVPPHAGVPEEKEEGPLVKAKIKRGATTEEVKAAFGNPESVSGGSGGFEIWFYEDGHIAFQDGKVSSWNDMPIEP